MVANGNGYRSRSSEGVPRVRQRQAAAGSGNDPFIAVGELALFVALADGWQLKSRVAAWSVTGLGLALSVAGNVGHIGTHDLASRATAAVPPLAAAAAASSI
jgi:hypothetical protein